MEPEVLVLDEPTAGLDPRGVADLNTFINSLSKKYGMTVIFSTHDVGLVPEVADYIYVMDKGRIVASGTVDEIFMQPDMLKSVRLDVPVIPKLSKRSRKTASKYRWHIPMRMQKSPCSAPLANDHDRRTVPDRTGCLQGQRNPPARCPGKDSHCICRDHRTGCRTLLYHDLYGWGNLLSVFLYSLVLYPVIPGCLCKTAR